LKKFINEDGAREFMRALKVKEKELEQVEQLTPRAKFDAADMTNEYVFHRLLSREVHNDSSALAGRHRSDYGDGTFSFMLHKVAPDSTLAPYFKMTAAPPLRSCVAMHGRKPARPDNSLSNCQRGISWKPSA